jgi:sodium-dependent dicarboxylate transporter 2/3/5
LKNFFSLYKKQIALATGVLLFLFFFLINPLALLPKAKIVLAIASLMISWWIFDALPLAVVALLPIILFPLFDISPIKEVTKSYSDSIIFLFMGGFFIGIAIEKWKLHKRIALNLIKKTGTNGNKIILGFIISTGFLSLWLSNTATTMMMYPIALSVIHIIEMNEPEEKKIKNFSVVLMLCIAYASNFALGTIIGTPPNVAYVNYISDKFNYNIGFTDWMIVFMPLTILLLLALYWVMVRWLFPNNIKHNESGAEYINEEVSKLGKMSLAEKRTCYVFVITVLLWIFKDLLNSMQNIIQLDDTIIALMGAVSLFIIPADEKHEQSLLSWEDTSKMAWGILILFGGGIAMAKALEDVKLIDQLGGFFASYSTGNVLMMILIVTTFSVFLSEVMGNVAQVIVMAPVVSSVAVSLHMDPLMLGIPMTLGASCASMLPMGTPPNAIVFASGHIKMKDMVRSGFVLNIISIIIITLFCYFIQPLIMKLAI